MSAAKHLSPPQLQAMIHDGGELALLDVREAGQFGESHLLFATPLPYSRLELDIGALVPRQSARIVLCDDGETGVSELAATRLQSLGYSDVALLAGGTRGWAAAGHTLFAGVNVPSKLFGELVEHEYHTPRVTVTELARMQAAHEDFVIVDGRPFAEYQKMNIPGGICCPNAELPLRIREIVKDPKTTIVVNCAGRTRSILGAQILINFGVPNPVYALENGTQGWVLADMELERGAARRYSDHVDERKLAELKKQARTLAERHGIRWASAADFEAWLADPGRTTYLLDVRTAEEFKAGSIPGAVHAPGGQLIQATDQWVGIRNARIVLIDGEGVRAPVVASWLKQFGCDVCVLEDGIRAQVVAPRPAAPKLPELLAISARALMTDLDAGQCVVVDLGPSMSYRKAHIPGARWSIRPRLRADVQGITTPVALVTDEPDLARAAAIDLLEAGIKNLKLLDGGSGAWAAAGYSTQATPAVPRDAECIDYLFFVHDRHAGNHAAMRQYLAWETGLMAQLSAQDRTLFRVGVT